jgi:uncharacterized protein (DUF4213/DUF364 family)
MPAGRPRKYDYIKEAQDLEAWAQLDTSLNLYGFTKDKPYLACQMTEFAQASEEFSLSLKKAKELIALRREQKLCEGKLHIAAWGRSARMYDSLLKQQEDQDKDDDAERKAKIMAAAPVNPMTPIIQQVEGKSAELVGRTSDS